MLSKRSRPLLSWPACVRFGLPGAQRFGDFGAARPPIFDLIWSGASSLDPTERAGSLAPDANYLGLATSSGAVSLTPMGALVLESSSSAGPISLGLTTLPDGTAGPGPQVAQSLAPWFVSLNGVSISGTGGFPEPEACPSRIPGRCLFFGTSAAVPHSAACAALVHQALGERASVAKINARLAATARSNILGSTPALGALPAGAGLLDCQAAILPPLH